MKREKKIFSGTDKVKGMLEKLYPGEDIEQKYRKYKSKRAKAFFAFLLLGTGTCICVYASSRIQGRLQEGTHLYRNEWGEGSYEIVLTANTGEGANDIIYEVPEREYTDKELIEKKERITEMLPYVIKGENESLASVRSHLRLPASVDDYPFAIVWKSSDYGKIRADGTVDVSEVGVEGEEVTLTAQLSYGEQKWQQDFAVILFPERVSKEQEERELILQALKESDAHSAQQSRWYLPVTVGDETVIWKENIPKAGLEFLFLGIAGAVMIVFAMNNDLQNKIRKREKELTERYPEFVSKLQLYIGAGLSMRNAFLRIGGEYKAKKQKFGKKSFLYEEVLIACYQFSNGRAEEEVYRKFAKRCDEIHYRKLIFLLIACNRQGNQDILKQLAKESCDAWEEKRSSAKKRGEEAGTKLLFPMMLMLLVVMILILIPVYTGF